MQAESVRPFRTRFGSSSDSAQEGHSLLQLIDQGFILVDGQFRVSDVNSAGLEMARQSESDFVGRTLSELAPDLKYSLVGRKWMRAIRENKPMSALQLHTWADGRQSWLQLHGHPTAAGYAIFYRDVTEQRYSEEELKRTQALLMHASRLSAMGTMAATLAHEIAQPLTSAGNAIDAGTRLIGPLTGPQIQEAQGALHLAGASVRRGIEILRRLRTFVAKGHIQARTEDLQAIVTDASVLAFPQAQQCGIDIRLRSDPDARWVQADAVQIQQVLINLINNAIEAMSGDTAGVITITTAAFDSEMVSITVDDTGPGLGESSPEELFAPFHSNKKDGLGIGLSVSRTIVEAHGGTITARPSPAGGVQFCFTLPRAGGVN
ncbi:MAG: ATP-binding protein [Allosphingosinicella sp.]